MTLTSESRKCFPPMRIGFAGGLFDTSVSLELTHKEAENWHLRKAKKEKEPSQVEWHQKQAEANKAWAEENEPAEPSFSRKIDLWMHGYYR